MRNEKSCKNCEHYEACMHLIVPEHEELRFCGKHFKDKSGWISVEDRLPECSGDEDIEVIVFITGAKEATTVYYRDGEFFDEYKDYYNVSHWMPMPEPPEEG